MSNVKAIRIEGRVPFSWAGYGADDEPLNDEALAFMARLFLTPSMGLKLTFSDDGYEPNERGGRTSMYRFTIVGQEALAWPAIDRLVAIIEQVGTVDSQEVMDLEA